MRQLIVITYLVWCSLELSFSAEQNAAVPSEAENAAEAISIDPLRISVTASEVQLDVVVLDNKGRPITDLTSADFEVYQNRLQQAVTSSLYIKNQVEITDKPAISGKGAPKLPPLPGTALKKEDVRRTIIFVVDNLSMDPEHLHNAKTSIKRFMEKQMQPDDLVAVIHTSYGNSALNFFSSDKRHITARVDSIAFAKLTEVEVRMEDGAPHVVYASERRKEAAKRMNDAMKPLIFDAQISAVSYSISALKNMPGRKILFFMSSMPAIPIFAPDMLETFEKLKSDAVPVDFDAPALTSFEKYGIVLDRLADEALRAGVVVNTLDTRGLALPDMSRNAMDITPHEIGRIPALNYSDGLNGLSYRTGGIFVQNSNFFMDGVGKEINNMISGYYLLSYIPPYSTFNIDRRNVYHRVEVKVKRKGAKVYTRDGFYGKTESDMDSAASAHPLQDAIFSPFKHADLNVNMSAGYIKDAKAGYLVRSWIHIDPKDVTIIETENGAALINLETVCLTSDINGHVHDLNQVKYTFNIKPEKKAENIAWMQKHGIRFSLLLPVKKPGSYAVRIAVQDTESGKTGSAWQPIEIPDLKKNGLALSDIFMITSADDLNWMLSNVMEQIAEGVFTPVFQADEIRSPALRSYLPGDSMHTVAMLYNATAKSIAASDIEIRSVLYKDGAELHRGEPVPVNQENVENSDVVIILREFTIGADMPPGDYILQLVATDRKNIKKKEGVSSKTLNFAIKER